VCSSGGWSSSCRTILFIFLGVFVLLLEFFCFVSCSFNKVVVGSSLMLLQNIKLLSISPTHLICIGVCLFVFVSQAAATPFVNECVLLLLLVLGT
jgi:hypothetical protein